MTIAFITNNLALVTLFLAGSSIVLCAIVIFLFVRYRQLSTTLAYLTRGAKAASLEDVIGAHGADITRIIQDIEDIHTDMTDLRTTLQKSLYRKHIVRYNPFKDLGGDQSFALALLDGNADGVVLSSLHTRDGTRVYAKPITHGVSPYKLSAEEEEAVRNALTPPQHT